MPVSEIFLVTGDAALHAALSEQRSWFEGIGLALREADNVPSPLSSDTAALIIDGAQLDKKISAQLHQAHEKKIKIFLLGEIDMIESVVAESFPKPFRLGHLLARIHFHFHTSRSQTGPLVFGSYRLEPASRHLIVQTTGDVIRLTEKETHLLEYLGHSQNPVPREELLAAIWGYDARIDTHTLETHIYRLRRKLSPDGKETDSIIAGHGSYRLAPTKA